MKSLIDGYDKARSDVANFLDEVRSIVYALKGYGGHDLGEFMRDLNYFRAISLDEDGGAEAITAPVDIAAAKDDFDTLRRISTISAREWIKTVTNWVTALPASLLNSFTLAWI